MLAGMTWPDQMDQYMPFGETSFNPYLADDDAAKADDHSFAGDFTAHHEAPALIEHLKELA